jgi:SAM-dependent methyltransferase
MNLSNYQCVNCGKSHWRTYSTFWSCENCGQKYSCVNGIPRLYIESTVGEKDKELRDTFYNGFLGTYYQHVMPFLSLPVRPAKASWRGWLAYALIVLSLIAIVVFFATSVSRADLLSPTIVQVLVLLLSLAVLYFLLRHRYVLYLLALAVPVKLSLLRNRFRPVKSFAQVHADALEPFLQRGNDDRLQVLDISTGSCNSLFRHGWMKLNADYTGLDLSETMLLQGQKFMAEQQVPMDFVLGDANRLPFEPETFDIVLNYGALNGFTEPKLALEEMARVTKKGGLVFFLDEQLYEEASFVERLYFQKVLSSHNTIHRCPVELMPASLGNIQVHQVYHFYYICMGHKL